jgi:hypothetical protein
MMSMALWLLTFLVPLQMVIGDMHDLRHRFGERAPVQC